PELGRAQARSAAGLTARMASLQGRKAIVTGGAQGIGAAIVRGLTAAGVVVAIVDRQEDKAKALAAEIGHGVVAIGADLGSKEGCEAAVRQGRVALGGVGILVNNAAPARNRDM